MVVVTRHSNQFSNPTFYSDDPEDFHKEPKKRKPSVIFASILLLVFGTYVMQTTLAANIVINTGAPLEFGQGISQTVACSGTTNLTITPNSAFDNTTGGGAFYFSSVTVSNIPTSCYGKDFTIKAYGNSGNTPLSLFNSNSNAAVVYNDNGTFKLGVGSTGATITRSAGRFTFTFTSPVALSTTVFRLTIESGDHTEFYGVGDTGPGGGTIFYYSAEGFNCGLDFSATGSPTGGKCNYLEAAPSTWSGSEDPIRRWASSGTNVSGITDDGSPYNNLLGIGRGLLNSKLIVTQFGAGTDYAAGLARAYRGGSKSDWYLPTTAELNELCKYAWGQTTGDPTVICTNPGGRSILLGLSGGDIYWSASERSTGAAWYQILDNGEQSNFDKDYSPGYRARAIRAF